MENQEFIAHAAEVFRRNETMQRINNGQRMTIAEIKKLLTTATVNGRKLEFYELEEPINRLAQAKNDQSLALTFVGSVLKLDNVARKQNQAS